MSVATGGVMTGRRVRVRSRRGRPVLDRWRPLVCLAVAGLALCLPDRPLAVPALPSEWRPHRTARLNAVQPLPEPAPRRLSQAEFDYVWSQTKFAMAACNSAVEDVQLSWRVRGEIPSDAALRLVRERCQRGSVEVGEVVIPASARAGVGFMLEQAREACQRSMVEKQLGLAALRGLAETPPDSLEAYEARIRIEAVPRSSVNCGASFAAAAAAARLHMAELEVAGA